MRARIVLAHDGADVAPIVVVAHELHIAADTVRKWRRRFLVTRLDGLVDEPCRHAAGHHTPAHQLPPGPRPCRLRGERHGGPPLTST
ncbi:helix-turn-helix domain-containing protein [Streptomyces sp. NPDC001828]|uniref:helix-turn-helix domain-containing protein n=1 Tax=Streptomyces sp. NPDC001828 TaxID=3364615 RepID=UPI00369B2AFD